MVGLLLDDMSEHSPYSLVLLLEGEREKEEKQGKDHDPYMGHEGMVERAEIQPDHGKDQHGKDKGEHAEKQLRAADDIVTHQNQALVYANAEMLDPGDLRLAHDMVHGGFKPVLVKVQGKL